MRACRVIDLLLALVLVAHSGRGCNATRPDETWRRELVQYYAEAGEDTVLSADVATADTFQQAPGAAAAGPDGLASWMTIAKEMCDAFRKAETICDRSIFKYPYISGLRVKYKTISVCDSPYKVLNARKMIQKSGRCCAAITRVTTGYQNAASSGVYDGKNSELNFKGGGQAQAESESRALTQLVDALAALVDCGLNVKDNRAEVLATWRNKWQVEASRVGPGFDSGMIELEDLDVAMLADLVARAVVCYYSGGSRCDLIGQLFIDYAEKNFKLLAERAKSVLVQAMDSTIGALVGPVQEYLNQLGDVKDPAAQWFSALGDLDPTTTAEPSLSRMDWWIKNCKWLAKDAQVNCFGDDGSYCTDVTNCPHLDCLCSGFAGDGSLPPSPYTDAVTAHDLMAAFQPVYTTKSLVLQAQSTLSTLMELRNVMVKLSSTGDNSTHVGNVWEQMLGSALNMLEMLKTAKSLIKSIQRFPAFVQAFQKLPSLMPTLLHAADAARRATDLLSAARSAQTTLERCQSLDYSSCYLNEVWANIGQNAPVIPYDGRLPGILAAEPNADEHVSSNNTVTVAQQPPYGLRTATAALSYTSIINMVDYQHAVLGNIEQSLSKIKTVITSFGGGGGQGILKAPRVIMKGLDLKSYNRWFDIILDVPQLSTKTIKLLGIKFDVPVIRSYKRYTYNIPTPNQHVPVVALKIYFQDVCCSSSWVCRTC